MHDTSTQPNEAIDQNEVSIVVQPIEANKPNRIRVVKQHETTKRNETPIVVQTVDGNESYIYIYIYITLNIYCMYQCRYYYTDNEVNGMYRFSAFLSVSLLIIFL